MIGAFADRTQSPDLARFILDQRGRRSDPAWTEGVLAALGNAASVETFDYVLERSQSESDDVRAGAIAATERVLDPRVDDRLREALGDPAGPVRATAVKTLEARGSMTFDAEIERLLLSDPEARVRGRAVSYFARRPAGDPSARAKLQRAALSDPSETVRNFAREALEGPR